MQWTRRDRLRNDVSTKEMRINAGNREQATEIIRTYRMVKRKKIQKTDVRNKTNGRMSRGRPRETLESLLKEEERVCDADHDLFWNRIENPTQHSNKERKRRSICFVFSV